MARQNKASARPGGSPGGVELRTIGGGLLMQTVDVLDDAGDAPAGWRLVSGDPVDDETLADLQFA